MILAGRNGQVKWDPTGAGGVTAVVFAAIKAFTLSLKAEKINVTLFRRSKPRLRAGSPLISAGA